MGFRKQRKIYHLIWNEGDLAGLEVKVRALSVGEVLEMSESAKNATDISSSIAPLAAALQWWNLEDEQGRSIPATLKGIKALDLPTIMEIVNKWVSVQAEVDTPLQPKLNSGGISDLESLNLDGLSKSLAS